MPLDQYKRNVQAILRHPLISSQKPRLILITPPPFDEHQWGDGTRTAEHTKKYADACRQAGEELGVVVLDIWSVFMEKAGWKPGHPLAGSKSAERNEVLGELLHDGRLFRVCHALCRLTDSIRVALQSNWIQDLVRRGNWDD